VWPCTCDCTATKRDARASLRALAAARAARSSLIWADVCANAHVHGEGRHNAWGLAPGCKAKSNGGGGGGGGSGGGEWGKRPRTVESVPAAAAEMRAASRSAAAACASSAAVRAACSARTVASSTRVRSRRLRSPHRHTHARGTRGKPHSCAQWPASQCPPPTRHVLARTAARKAGRTARRRATTWAKARGGRKASTCRFP
jgi:hypothetical protein